MTMILISINNKLQKSDILESSILVVLQTEASAALA